MATLYDVEEIHDKDGTLLGSLQETREVQPVNGTDFNLQELYKLLRCEMIEVLYLPDGRIMVFDEEAKLREPAKPRNMAADPLARLAGIAPYPYDWISGPALVCKNGEIK